MNIKDSKLIALLNPSASNPRNSEGSFITLDDGRIAFAYSKYVGNSYDDDAACLIACIYSYDGGETFDTEHIETLVDSAEYGVSNVMSVTLRRMDNGDIGMFYLVKFDYNGFTECRLRRYSGDFSHPVSETVAAPGKIPGCYVVNNDRVERLSSGRWIFLGARHHVVASPEEKKTVWFDHRGVVYAFYSDDDGATWSFSESFLSLNNPYSESGLQEPGCVELPGGALYGYFRTDLKHQYESVSVDRGETWFAPQASRFTSPNSPMLIKKNPYTDRYYAIWNPSPSYLGRPKYEGVWSRTPLVIAESTDGVHFDEPIILEDDPTRGFCYPAMHFIDEKNILLGYCSGGKDEGCCLNRITIRKITLE